MASILPPPPSVPDTQCARCGTDFHVGDPPSGTRAVWISCPDCGIRLWHDERSASVLLGIHDIDEAQAHWQSGTAVH